MILNYAKVHRLLARYVNAAYPLNHDFALFPLKVHYSTIVKKTNSTTVTNMVKKIRTYAAHTMSTYYWLVVDENSRDHYDHHEYLYKMYKY